MSAARTTIDNYERRKRTGLRRDPMQFAASLKSLLVLAFAAALTACGRGGRDGGELSPQQGSLVAATGNVAVNVRSATTITLRLNGANGATPADGTTTS